MSRPAKTARPVVPQAIKKITSAPDAMPTAEILRELEPVRTLAQMEKALNETEQRFEDDEGRITTAELVSLNQGTVEGRETNIAGFQLCDEAPLPLALLGDLPAEPSDRDHFFQNLGRVGYELIAYSDVLVRRGRPPAVVSMEVAICRLLVIRGELVAPSPPAPAPAPTPPVSTPVPAPPAPAPAPAPVPPAPASGDGNISEAAFDLILEFEGLDQPGCWPGAASGVSLGVGYDLGYVTAAQFQNDWARHLTASHFARLKTALGVKARAARAMAPRFADIKVSRAAGLEVFQRSTLPRFSAEARRAFPGLEKLPPNAQGALVSLVFNRGPDLTGDRRREMAAIRRILDRARLPATLASTLEQIAGQIRAMKRLWNIHELRGLHRRRDAEAALVLSGAAPAAGLAAASVFAGPAAPVLAAGAAAALAAVAPAARSTGELLVRLAAEHVGRGELYRLGAFVPKNQADHRGPWDCAEFVSWVIFQATGLLYGCEDNGRDPARADAYTGYWERDAKRLGRMIPVAAAAGVPGAVLLRYPPATGTGHIAFSDGRGGTLEAKSRAAGVVADVVRGRRWDTGVLIEGIAYQGAAAGVPSHAPAKIYFVGAPGMSPAAVVDIQNALRGAGFDPGASNGIFGDQTAGAVLAFQDAKRLMADGEVGPETARALGVTL